jgi:hypothetical protein
MKTQHIFLWKTVVFIISSIILTSTGSAEELRGTIIKTNQKMVEIKLEGDLLPQPGDPVTIGFTLPSLGFIALKGEWIVSAVSPTHITAAPRGETSQPQKDQLVLIQSSSPRQKNSQQNNISSPSSHKRPAGYIVPKTKSHSSPQIQNKKADQAMWALVSESNKPDDIRAYLDTFPDGIYSINARMKLDELEHPQNNVEQPQTEYTPPSSTAVTSTPAQTTSTQHLSHNLKQYLAMVESPDYRQKYKGAKYIYRKNYGKNNDALQVLARVLTEESKKISISRGNNKTLIYICRIIAISENGDYVKVLKNVAATTPNPALRKYAVRYTDHLQRTTGIFE